MRRSFLSAVVLVIMMVRSPDTNSGKGSSRLSVSMPPDPGTCIYPLTITGYLRKVVMLRGG
jgi:hypothetical protein